MHGLIPSKRGKYYGWSEREKEILSEIYPRFGLQACVNHFGIRETQIKGQLKKLGLTLNEKQKNISNKKKAVFRGKKRPEHSEWLKKNHPMLGKHLSKKTKDKISISQHSVLPKNAYSRAKRGYYDIGGKKMYFRSMWEANYALYLNWLVDNKHIKSWLFEPDVFWFEKIRRGVRSYCPDFKILNNDNSIEYHEIKGYFDSKSKTKMKRMKKYHPKTKLLLIEGKEYKQIIKKMGGLISFF